MINQTTFFRLLLISILAPVSFSMNAQQSITWTDIVNISASGDSVTNIGPEGWGSSGAASVEFLDFVTEGFVEFTVPQMNLSSMFGLSENNQNAHYSSIEFAIYLTGNKVEVYESAVRKYYPSTHPYAPGDTFRVERVGSQIVYMHNGSIFYTSGKQSTSQLAVDLSLFSLDASLVNVNLSPSFGTTPTNTNQSASGVTQSITWVNQTDMGFVDDKIVKIGDSGYTGASSTKWLDFVTDGWVEWTVHETGTGLFAGLSETDVNGHYNTIGFAIYLTGNKVEVYESAVRKYNPSSHPYAPGDTFRVERVGSQIVYKHNGSIFYTSGKQSTSKLVADISIFNKGASLKNVNLSGTFGTTPTNTNQGATSVTQSITWVNHSDLGFVDDKIVKIGDIGYTGASSTKWLDFVTDGWVEWTVHETGTGLFAGLSETDVNGHYNTIGFAIYLTGNKVEVYESAVRKYNPSSHPYAPGDTFRVERIGSQIVYRHNDNVFYTSGKQSTSQLVADISMYNKGASIKAANLSPSFGTTPTNTDQSASGVTQSITWVNHSDLGFVDDKIVKIGDSGYTGASSTKWLDFVTDGWVEWTVHETGTGLFAGLSETDVNGHYNTIGFAIYLTGNKVEVYESAVRKYNPSSHPYAPGDTFRVERMGAQIVYKHNDNVFYTSNKLSTSQLFADISLYNKGTSVKGATLSPSFDTIPTNTDQNAQGVSQSVAWVNFTDMGFVDDKIIKIGNTGYTGASSTDTLSANSNGWMEWTVHETGTSLFAGLSETYVNGHYSSIDYAIYLTGGKVVVYESGVRKYFPSSHPYATGDTFRVERIGTQVTYKHNGTIFYTSAKQSSSQLLVDISLYSKGASMKNVTLSDTFEEVPTIGTGGVWSQDQTTAYYESPVAIGTNTAHEDHLLSVDGKIAAKGVKVTLDGWADFVFENDYSLRSLEELQKFIEKNGHLPEIPKTQMVLEKGIYLGEMNKKLLQKIEEISLYLIQQNDRLKALEKEK